MPIHLGHNDEGKEPPTCRLCGHTMRYIKGSYGDFWGCTAYPNCKNKVGVLEEEHLDDQTDFDRDFSERWYIG